MEMVVVNGVRYRANEAPKVDDDGQAEAAEATEAERTRPRGKARTAAETANKSERPDGG